MNINSAELINNNWGSVLNTKPIFVTGVYRSGTTFTASLISSSPLIAGSSSALKFLRMCLGRYGDLSKKEIQKKLIEETSQRLRVRWGIEFNPNNVLDAIDASRAKSYAEIYDILMRKIFIKNDAQVDWLEKINLAWTKIPDFLSMFPNGKVVHVIRDPRDVMASYKKHTFEIGYTYLDAALNSNSSFTMAKNYRDERVIVVRAEDLYDLNSKRVQELFSFLNLPFDKKNINYNNMPTFGENWKVNSSYSESIINLPEGSFSRWKSKLSDAEILFAEMVTQPYLTYFGYQPSGIKPCKKLWMDVAKFFDDDFISKRYSKFLKLGSGTEGYRSDPIKREMNIAFSTNY